MKKTAKKQTPFVYPEQAEPTAGVLREEAVAYSAEPPSLDAIWRIIQETAQENKNLVRAQREFIEAQRKLFENAEKKAEERAEQERKKAEERAEQERKKANERAEQERKQYEQERLESKQERERLERQREIDAKESKKRVDKMESMFNMQWGRLVESLVEGDLVPLLQAHGINVQQTTRQHKGCFKGRNYEFDIIAIDGDTIVVVEVKTTLSPSDVKDFLERLSNVRQWIPIYSDKRVLGAVAYLQQSGAATAMAAKRGLFVIRATGSSASITNPETFQPRAF